MNLRNKMKRVIWFSSPWKESKQQKKAKKTSIYLRSKFIREKRERQTFLKKKGLIWKCVGLS